MKHIIKNICLHSFVRFGIIGAYCTLIDFGIFMFLYIFLGWHAGVANVTAFLIANLQSYALNKYWSFKHGRHELMNWREYLRFFSASLFTGVTSTTIITLGAKYYDPLILKIITIATLPFISYALYRLILKKPDKR